jgi:arylsulfatase A-like enzyme
MLRRLLDSPWFYFGGAALLLLVAVATQFRWHTPSRKVAPVQTLSQLRDRGDINVVFLLVDTLRADRLGTYGYSRPTTPNIDQAARYGIVFDNCVSQSSWTKTSMASLWTATNPIRNGVLRYNHVLPDEATMPAELFQKAGYRTVGLWRNGWVEPNFGFSQGFDIYFKPTPGAERARIHRETTSPHPLLGTDEDLTVAALDFLRRFGKERFFLYMHFMDVHQYVYDEAASIFGTSYSDVYDQSINWTDRLIATVLGALEDEGVLDHTLVVISADHGEAFLEHGFEGHARNLYEEVAHVPFIILPPFLLDPGIRVPQTVSNADVWPTILDILGMPPLPGADGRSMLPLILKAGGVDPGQPTDGLVRPVYAEIAKRWGNPKFEPEPMVAVTWDGKRGILQLDKPDSLELYDQKTDRFEHKNIAREDPKDAAKARELIAEYQAHSSPPWGKKPKEVELDEMRLNQLRALGYVIKE